MGLLNSLTGNAIRYLIWILIAFCVSSIIYFFWETDQRIVPKADIQQRVEEPLILVNPTLQEFETDRLKLRLIAEKAQIFEKEKRTLLTNISAELYESGRTGPTTYLQARFGEMTSPSNLVRLWGNVRLDTNEGQRLITEELFVNNEEKTIFNQVAVTVYSGEETIKAASMHYDLGKGVLMLNQPRMQVKL